MDIRYYQKDGRIGVEYDISEKEMDFLDEEGLIRGASAPDELWLETIDVGLVPESVQARGEKAIEAYAVKRCRARHKKHVVAARKLRDEIAARQANVNREISVRHQGETLTGRITTDGPGSVRVTLEAPVCSDRGIVFDYPNCFAESVSGRHVFDHDGNLTDVLLRDAEGALVRLYKERVARANFGKTVNLVETLNKRKASRGA